MKHTWKVAFILPILIIIDIITSGINFQLVGVIIFVFLGLLFVGKLATDSLRSEDKEQFLKISGGNDPNSNPIIGYKGEVMKVEDKVTKFVIEHYPKWFNQAPRSIYLKNDHQKIEIDTHILIPNIIEYLSEWLTIPVEYHQIDTITDGTLRFGSFVDYQVTTTRQSDEIVVIDTEINKSLDNSKFLIVITVWGIFILQTILLISVLQYMSHGEIDIGELATIIILISYLLMALGVPVLKLLDGTEFRTIKIHGSKRIIKIAGTIYTITSDATIEQFDLSIENTDELENTYSVSQINNAGEIIHLPFYYTSENMDKVNGIIADSLGLEIIHLDKSEKLLIVNE